MDERHLKFDPTESDLDLIKRVESGVPVSFSVLDMAAPEFRDQVLSYVCAELRLRLLQDAIGELKPVVRNMKKHVFDEMEFAGFDTVEHGQFCLQITSSANLSIRRTR